MDYSKSARFIFVDNLLFKFCYSFGDRYAAVHGAYVFAEKFRTSRASSCTQKISWSTDIICPLSFIKVTRSHAL